MVCDAKPVGTYSNKELIDLEHKYRLLLKKDGFKDIEIWDNQPKKKVKQLKFISGHVRYRNRTVQRFNEIAGESLEYSRIIGLYAYHHPNVPDKYRLILQDYSLSGNMRQSIRNTKSLIQAQAVFKHLHTNMNKILEFYKKEFAEE